MPAIYETTVVHVRRRPKVSRLRHRGYLWLVDLDELPALPRPLAPFARFDGRDHGDGGASIRDDLLGWLDGEGVDLRGGRVVMLANARVAGHVFNPLTVFWCYRGSGDLACVVAEVHNTYGGRHRYLLHPDSDGNASVAKQFTVSPFLTVDGHYRLRVPEPGARLAVSITLWQEDQPVLIATLHGRRRSATQAVLLRLLLRYPLAPLRASAAIRAHGIKLWLRGLPVVARPRPKEEITR